VVACVRCDRAGRSRLAKLIASMGPGFQEHRGGRKNSEEQLNTATRAWQVAPAWATSHQGPGARCDPTNGGEAPAPIRRRSSTRSAGYGDGRTRTAPVARLPNGCHAQPPPQKSASRAAAAAGRAASTILEGGKRLNVPKTRMDFGGLGMRCPEKPSIRIERFLPCIWPPPEADILQDDTDEQSQ
jgi:hypothetical protein